MLTACAREPYPELAIGCRVEAAAKAADAGDLATIDAACSQIPEGKWRDECHFRAGEQLGKAGRTDASLQHCAAAGDFGRFCLTHAGWGLPASDARSPAELADLARRTIPGKLGEQAADVLRVRAWFNRYVGTGTADPTIAQAATGPDAAPARTAWAIEAVRLAGSFDAAKASWIAGSSLTGAVLPIPQRVGRYENFPDMGAEGQIPKVLTFADSTRFIGETDEEDLDIALIEGMYFHIRKPEPESGAAFARWLEDPRPRVRYTAIRRYRCLPSEGVEARLTAMAQDPDPIVQAHIADALKFRTWMGRQR